MSFKIKGEEEENPTYLNLMHDASGNIWLEAYNKTVSAAILSIEGNGTIRLIENSVEDLRDLGFKNDDQRLPDRAKVLFGE